jgi:Flp pilus assembly protein TadB
VIAVGIPSALAAAAVVVLVGPSRSPAGRVVALIDRSRPHRFRRSPERGSARAASRPMADVVPVTLVVGFTRTIGRTVRRRLRRPPDGGLDAQLGGALVVAAVAFAVAPVLAAPAALVVWALPAIRRRTHHRRLHASLASEAPDLVELFRLAIGSGLTVHQSVAAVAPRARGISGAAVAEVPPRVARGERLADALDRLGELDDSIRPLATALASAERYGVPLGPTLDRLALESRLARRRRAEEVARRLPVQMLFPLVLCILPAFTLLTVVPLVLAELDGLRL